MMSVRAGLSQHQHRPSLQGLERQGMTMMMAMRIVGAMRAWASCRRLEGIGRVKVKLKRVGGTGRAEVASILMMCGKALTTRVLGRGELS